jgi:hypothetical protein
MSLLLVRDTGGTPMTYWIMRTNADDRTDGHYSEITVTTVSFENINAAIDYARQMNEKHHEYMLRTHDKFDRGLHHDIITEDRIEEARRIGVIVKDNRR